MFMRIKGRNRGVTIIEVLVSIILAVIVTAIGYRCYVMSKTIWLYTFEQGNLDRAAMLGIEKIVHGVENSIEVIDGQNFNVRKGIVEAGSITTPALGGWGNQLVFADPWGAVRSFSQVGDRLVYTDSGNVTRDIIGEDVNQVLFSRAPADVGAADGVVYIRLILRRNVLDRQLEARTDTSVQARNM